MPLEPFHLKFQIGTSKTNPPITMPHQPNATIRWTDPSADRRFAPSTLVSRPSTGFTLIELLVVVAIIALLAGLVIATVGSVQKSSARNKAQAEVEAISRAIENYKLEIGSYPPETPPTALYNELTGNGTINRSKVYFEPPKSMVTNSQFIDPWGSFYIYVTDNPGNVGLFDIYSKAGQANADLFIRN
jgi:general secretion pathway protein G